MEDAKRTMDEKEKIKYFLHTLSKNYREKIILKDSDTVEVLSNKSKQTLISGVMLITGILITPLILMTPLMILWI